MRRLIGVLAAAVAVGAWAFGQERTGAVWVSVVPERADWTYAIGAPARFRVTITRDGHALELAGKGFITLQVGIHGIPVDLPAEVYDALLAGAFNSGRGYTAFNLDDPDRYYYRRVYLGCLRANDFLVSDPKWDGKNLVVTGGSQGGALTITTAGLDPRVTALAPYYPALSDMAGYLKGRAGGWPHLFKDEKDGHRTPAKIRTAAYYDVVNFARRVKAPGLYSWGWNDEVCPPTSTYAAYNVVTAPKELLLAVETGHFTVPEQTEKVDRWIEAQVGRR